MDAILRTLVRLFFTRRQLLNWITASQAREKTGYKLQNFIQQLVVALVIVTGAVIALLLINPEGIRLAAPFLLLWGVAPVVARGLSLPPWVDRAELSLPQDTIYFRLAGRRIWRFFTTFVTANENFLPPDNFQESPNPVLAHRTSPTNIGLYLLSAVAARQFGWLGLLDYVDRIEQTVSTLNKLTRINGHFYNWYDTQDLRVLEPAYVSTVDSGNLAGNLLALAQECRELKERPLDFLIALAGILDTYNLTVLALENLNDGQRTQTVTLQQLRKNIIAFGELLDKRPANVQEWLLLWQQLKTEVVTLLDLVQLFSEEREDKDSELLAWVRLLHNDIFSHLRDIDVLIPWFNFSCEIKLLTTTKTQAVLVQKNLSLETKLSEIADLLLRSINWNRWFNQ